MLSDSNSVDWSLFLLLPLSAGDSCFALVLWCSARAIIQLWEFAYEIHIFVLAFLPHGADGLPMIYGRVPGIWFCDQASLK